MGALGPGFKWDAMGLKGFFQGLGHRVRYGLGFVVFK